MNKLTILACALLGGTLCAQIGQGTFYVDATNGSDTSSGRTPSAAWKTLTKASNSVGKDSTIMVLPGTYKFGAETFPVVFGTPNINQDNTVLIGVEGPGKTIIDGAGTYNGLGMLRVRENAKGFRITGFSFKNMSAAFWSMGIRLGSASGDTWRANAVEVDNCIFDGLNRGIVLFGSPANTRQSTDCKIHNNLFLNNQNTYPCVAIYGDGNNHFHNNTIVSPGHDGLYLDSIVTSAPCKAIIKNNIIVNGGVNGIHVGPAGGAVTIEYNNVYNNKTAYTVPTTFKIHASNISKDPVFVDTSKGNYRLKANSPLIDAGTPNVVWLRHDLDYYPQLFAFTSKGRLPDIGAYEAHTNDVTMTTPPKVGGTAKFALTGAAGLAAIFVDINQSTVPQQLPFGVNLMNNYIISLGITSSQTTVSVSIPNNSALEGVRATLQGVYRSGTQLELLNVITLYVAK